MEPAWAQGPSLPAQTQTRPPAARAIPVALAEVEETDENLDPEVGALYASFLGYVQRPFIGRRREAPRG